MARILVVDDEKPLADTLATILRLKQYEVEVAYDGWRESPLPSGSIQI